MKVSDIVNGVTSLQKLNGLDLSIPLALQVRKNMEECEPVLKMFEEKRKALVDSLQLKEGEVVPPESIKAIENHLDEEIELNLKKLSLKALEASGAKLSAGDITTIIWMFEEDA
jgi:hypothetical protein